MKTSKRSLLVAVTVLLLLVLSAAYALPSRIGWDPYPLVGSITLGEEATYSVTLTNTGYFRIPLTHQLRIAVEGDIAPYVTIKQPEFPRVFRRGNQVTFDVTFLLPDSPMGVYEGQLVLQRTWGKEGLKVWLADVLPVRLAIEDSNHAPVADAGPDQTVFFGDTITLDGSGSSDVDGDPLSYLWSISVPSGSGAALNDSTIVAPSFDVDLSGTYVGQLIVNDGTVDSVPDTVTITTENACITAGEVVDDGNPCTIDSCDPINGVQHTPVADNSPCPNGNVCDGAEICAAGVCQPGTPLDPDDGNACTADSCDPINGVQHTPVADNSPCPNDDVCDGAEICAAGVCQPGTPLDPDDGNACTADSCDPINGVQHTPVADNSPCPNDDVCDGAEICAAGVCQPGTPLDPDDGNACTTDSCDPINGVQHTPVADNSPCPNGNVCDGNETCAAGVCKSGTPLNTDDGDPCTIDSCDPITGVSHNPAPAGTLCADKNPCDGNEVCNESGQCVTGAPAVIDDGNPATLDTCEEGRIVHRPVPDLDGSVAMRFPDAVAFLYTGSDPIQQDVTPGFIEARRVAVVHGTVTDRAGEPISGVRVDVLNRPDLGWTLTQGNGSYQLAVNGGGWVTIRHRHDDYLEVQRKAEVPWHDYKWAADIVMTRPDAIVSELDFNDPTDTQVAVGSEVTDESGTRRETLIVLPGTQATMVMPDGSTQPVTDLHVQLTEYTVGDSGPAAMPAELPPTMGYTYAVDYSAREALAAGAKSVAFDPPLISYMENYLQYAVGSGVPMGSYDRERGVWLPYDNGVVLEIVAEASGLAELDIDGDGLADDQATLDTWEITDHERAQLLQLYSVGDSLWRVRVPHFSPWDKNSSVAPPEDAVVPDNPPPRSQEPVGGSCKAPGSIISCQNQTVIEQVPIAGTPFFLAHASDRVPGHKIHLRLDIPASGPVLPESIKAIAYMVEIAGKTMMGFVSGNHTSLANKVLSFTDWDGTDHWGRKVQGRVPAKVRVGYKYACVPQETGEFGTPGNGVSIAFGGNNSKCDITLWEEWKSNVWVGGWDETRRGLGGWSISAHHPGYDQGGSMLWLGDGTHVKNTGKLIDRFAGNGTECPWVRSDCGDGGPALQANLSGPSGLAALADGSLLFGDTNRIRKIDPDGIITTLAGNGRCSPNVPLGDGGPAVNAAVCNPKDVDVGPDGSIYIADYGHHRVRRIDPEGIITTIAGTGNFAVSGDGGPAELADVAYPLSVDMGPGGSLYIATLVQVRRIDPAGIISTFAGSGAEGCYSFWATECGDGGLATQADLYGLVDVVAAPDGTVYISQSVPHRIRRVLPSGIIDTYAGLYGAKFGYWGEGLPADSSPLNDPSAITVSPDGTLVFVDGLRVRRISPEGLVYTIAGHGQSGPSSGDGDLARSANFHSPQSVAVGPKGAVYVADGPHIRKVDSLFETVVPSPGGGQLFVFGSGGRHERTLDSLTGATLLSFNHDDDGRLLTITDADNNVTRIHRNANHEPVSIEAPFGQPTDIELGSLGLISKITAPDGASWEMTYHGTLAEDDYGQLSTFETPRGEQTSFTYDPFGRLEKDEAPDGSSQSFTHTGWPWDYEVTRTTKLGRQTKYAVEYTDDGSEVRTNELSDTTTGTSTVATDGSTSVKLADGTQITTKTDADPRFGLMMPYVKASTITLPSGLSATTTRQRTAQLTDSDDPLSVVMLKTVTTTNGKTTTQDYDASTLTWTVTTPESRTVTTTLDERGRVVGASVPNIASAELTYDAHGRVGSMQQGLRALQLDYDTGTGYLSKVTNALTQETLMQHDAVGRPTFVTRPDSEQLSFGYDASGNLSFVTPPGKPSHRFGYTEVEQVATYMPPVAAGSGTTQTNYSYDLDRALDIVTRPDGKLIDLDYDGAGKLSKVTLPGSHEARYRYSESSGQLKELYGPYAVNLDYVWDGGLLTEVRWSGEVDGTVGWTYNNDFRVSEESIKGDEQVTFTYDNDGLLVTMGAMSLIRDANNGLLTGSTLGFMSDASTYDTYGALDTYTTSYNTTELFATDYERDILGRITKKTETMEGVTHVFEYFYDLAGRLVEVKEDNVVVEHYDYDANGNRVGGTYDAQDRILTYEGKTYTYTANGELLTTSDGTRYTYDVQGALLQVDLPDGRVVEYVIDGQGRRVGKKVDGALQWGLLYQGGLRPVAELDADGSVVSRFVYGTRINVPDYVVRGGSTYRVITDHLGSVRMVVGASTGDVVQRMSYDAYGRVLLDEVAPGWNAIPFGFAGGIFDRDTGLVRLGARDYGAEVGRWVSKDPFGFGGGDSNLYTYSWNDPVNWLDADGEHPVVTGLGILLFVLFTGATVESSYDTAGHAELAASAGVGRALGNVATKLACRIAAKLTGGAARAAKYGHLWQRASLDKAIARHAGPNATSWVSKTGKTIFENPATGRQVVVDPAGYFRIFQPKTIGGTKGGYLDMLGKVSAPARRVKGGAIKNVPLQGAELRQWTHFWIE